MKDPITAPASDSEALRADLGPCEQAPQVFGRRSEAPGERRLAR